ncbi:hypothetical protein ESA94_03535 [Lacibacter luteus]|uniref:DUF4190 domain-containing protein n=1 Tax=Lacibacter luteus TaxID=2508719 RepID=A0A4Q1CM26_9BACT|nr:hypothetical protein [Lacibacter luteus]RXK62097.1 hypothetical protein ESA94_03535 [Lacibacter luteus]
MKNVILATLLAMFFVAPVFTNAAEPILPVKTEPTTVVKKEKHTSFKSFRKATEKKLGRKLGLFERIGLWYYTTLTPEPEFDAKKANNQALAGFILGVCSLVIFPLLAIPGFFLSKSATTKEKLAPGTLEPTNKSLAKVGLILSIIGIVYLFVLIIYIAILIGAYGMGL